MRGFKDIWAVDFEFSAAPGERPDPICMVAWELTGTQRIRLWQDGIRRLAQPPYPTGPDSLMVAFYASAEVGCHLALGWPAPQRVLDLFTEFRTLTNGKQLQFGSGLLGALAYFGIGSIDTAEKESMRQLALRGGPWTEEERQALLDYCESDVAALARLLPAMAKGLDLPRALLRGRYMTAAARMEHAGIPIDTTALAALREHWTPIQTRLIEKIDKDFGVYEGRSFKAERFAQYLAARKIPWPTLSTGRLSLEDKTFKDMARAYPELAPLRELRDSLSQMRLAELPVGADGRNRCILSAFRSMTGRNQPSNSAFIFGPSVWLRSLIQPAAGFGLAYVDYSQQEFGIAAALSEDPVMMEAYRSGDPYLAFAKQAGAVPADATKATHGPVREQFKACVLAVQYGMGAESLAVRIGQPVARARELLQMHRQTYAKFWRWSDAVADHGFLVGKLWTVFGWTVHVEKRANDRSLRNFPMQANGAEMLRLACCLATERGIKVCAPVHDAILIEAPAAELDSAVAITQAAMEEASRLVLGEFRLRTDAKLVRHPERYADERGERMWATIWEIIAETRGGTLSSPVPGSSADVALPTPAPSSYLSASSTVEEHHGPIPAPV